MNKEVSSIKDQIIQLYRDGGIKADAARLIREKTSLGETQSKYWAKKIYDEYIIFEEPDSDQKEFDFLEQESLKSEDNPPSTKDEKRFLSDLEFNDRYIYNKEDDKYIFLLEKSIGKNIILSGETVKSIIKLYSNYDSDTHTINQVAIRHSIPRNALIYILKTLGITHDSIPVTLEELQDRDVDDIVDECIEDKRFALYQKLQKKDWLQTKEDAKKWNEFIVGKYNPLCDFLDTWEPPEYKYKDWSYSYPLQSKSDDVFLCILTDTHIGEWTKHSFTGDTYNSEKAIKNIFSYLSQIENRLKNLVTRPQRCEIVLMGDILNSCIDGETRRGTQLSNDIINEELFDIGLDVLISFIEGMLDIFGKVKVHATKGNHDSILVYGIYSACAKYFSKQPYITWNIANYWLDSFRINNNFFIYTHGKDDKNNLSLPKNSGKNLESYIQSLLLSKINQLQGIKGRYFITGHLHSYEHVEMNDFEYIRVPAIVNADDFAEGLGYRTKARQNCFIVGKDYIMDTFHFYF